MTKTWCLLDCEHRAKTGNTISFNYRKRTQEALNTIAIHVLRATRRLVWLSYAERGSRSALTQGRALVIGILASFSLLSCSTLSVVEIDSENQNSRVNYLIIHYTSVDFAESLRLLTKRTERPVSSHYLVPEKDDSSYQGRRLSVYQLVEEDQRAWHAGRSSWRGVTDLNTGSIGIEIVNRSTCAALDPKVVFDNPQTHCEFREFDAEQIELVISLIAAILRRHPDIEPNDILAHADVAFDRKLDPGPTFPWRKLFEHGIGAWYDDDTARRYRQRFEAQPTDVLLLQKALAAYGYDIKETGELDTRTRYALRAFQMHFRPSDWSGHPDAETMAILFALLEKYRPRSLSTLVKTS